MTPKSFRRARWYGVTKVDPETATIGICLSVDGEVLRFALPTEDAKQIADSVDYYLELATNSQAESSSGKPHSEGSTPDGGKKV